MIEAGLKAGDIITWENYPLQMDKAKPKRWFLYLGNQTVQAVVYQITTTTQYQYYEAGGSRVSNNYFRIPAGMGGLEKESILDLRFFEDIPELLVNRYKTDIERKGALNQDYINKFVKHLKIDKHIISMIKKDIYGYLRETGFKVA
jgi:hypothetical protein